MYNRIPHWTTSTDDRGTVDVWYADDMFNCLRLDVSRVPCIVTLSKVLSQLFVHRITDYIHVFCT